jgi:hypothetical protein
MDFIIGYLKRYRVRLLEYEKKIEKYPWILDSGSDEPRYLDFPKFHHKACQGEVILADI